MKCGRCVVKLNEKDKVKKIDRWQKIAEVAAKQSGRDIIPTINNVINIKNICNIIPKYDIVLLAYEKEANNSLKNELLKIKEKDFNRIGVIIGPEGGIDEKEADLLKQAGVKIITLGKRILRTETVALSVLSNIMYEFDMWLYYCVRFQTKKEGVGILRIIPKRKMKFLKTEEKTEKISKEIDKKSNKKVFI